MGHVRLYRRKLESGTVDHSGGLYIRYLSIGKDQCLLRAEFEKKVREGNLALSEKLRILHSNQPPQIFVQDSS